MEEPGLRDWGIPICVFTAGHLGKDFEDFTANRCAIPRRVFGFCCMLLKVNMKWNINDFQRLDSRVIGKTVSDLPAHLTDNRQLVRAIPARSSA